MIKRFHIVTLGCRTNQYESQRLTEELQELGYVSSIDPDADLCIINTCSVTNQADVSSRREIRKLARLHPRARLIVTGCMAGNDVDKLKMIDPRIEIFPNSKKDEGISSLFLVDAPRVKKTIERLTHHTRAFVKVQDGCNAFCSYCIVPFVRGRSRSRPFLEVTQEIQGLIAGGYQEIVLTGVNIGDMADPDLPTLVSVVEKQKGLRRLRISSIDPIHVDEMLIDQFVKSTVLCPHLHLVLQSGSNAILKKMNRKYTREDFLQRVKRLREIRSDFTFTTDIIVGFPGETESDFAETLNLIDQVSFAKVHVFPYSERANTRAASMPNKVPTSVILQRKEKAIEFSQEKSFLLRNRFLNETMEVLLEEGCDASLSGHTANFLPVHIDRGVLSPNQMVCVKMIENRNMTLWGEVV